MAVSTGQMDLPAAWRAAVAYCPFCSATGLDEHGAGCLHCGATGDLLGSMLREAWELGRDSVTSRLSEVSRTAALALEIANETSIGQRELKQRMGL